ncbi:hypothetical protein K470DRAFT_149681 [Piedraia hortae CBS 480.64]|uniref:Sphingolipid long chain base-responsive protein LSP1 n=1 Tax=Piedraia hortae CBS 480.64 TaxID=1314780 RepID=A0A6A7BRW3_9PEZI|nr:hypothetical protein K470DRAFT_149681 [Piedraia hortae CBS 480.64]
MLNRSQSTRSKKSENDTRSSGRRHFGLSSLRGTQQPDISRRLYKLIKTQKHQISSYEVASRESRGIASQLSTWGEGTEDDTILDVSDKVAVLLSEMAEQEDIYAQNLEESRGILKQIRNIEHSVQPSRTHKIKVQEEIQKLKFKEPESTKLVTLEQELVRAEAQCLVADAQLSNVTRQKFKEAFDVHTAAAIERAEKQLLLAQQARRLLNLVDDTPIAPGETRPPFNNASAAREALNDAEAALRSWSPSYSPIQSSLSRVGSNAVQPENISPSMTENTTSVNAPGQVSVNSGNYVTGNMGPTPAEVVQQLPEQFQQINLNQQQAAT